MLRTFFKVAVEIYRRNNPTMQTDEGLDPALLRCELIDRGQWENEHLDRLVAIMTSLPSAANASYYSQQMSKNRAFLELAKQAEGLTRQVQDKSLTLEEKQTAFEQAAAKAYLQKSDRGFVTIGDLVTTAVDKLAEKRPAGIPTGFRDLDRLIGSFLPSELIVVAGRPSMGKTAFAVNLMLNMAREGRRLAMYSLEMSAEALTHRLLSTSAKVDIQAIQQQRLTPVQGELILNAAAEIAKHTLFIDSSAMLSPAQMTVRLMGTRQREGRVDLVVVDYLQLLYLTDRRKAESRQQEITRICAELKALAMKAEVPVLLISQLNRACEQRVDRRPRLSDLRESGSIEQDADKVIMLHRNDYYKRSTERLDGIAECIVAKNRSGPTGTVRLVWLPSYASFENYFDDTDYPANGMPGNPA
jgi:replicative DNA helicase